MGGEGEGTLMGYNFVLVHGAWHGGWCWRRVADRLRASGHLVFTPTLTGLGERSHLLRPDLDLDVHIADVINVIKWERLSDVVFADQAHRRPRPDRAKDLHTRQILRQPGLRLRLCRRAIGSILAQL